MPATALRRALTVGAPAALLALPALAAAQTVPGIPPVPTVPTVPNIPGSQTERFRLIVEGTSTARRDLDLGADTGVCGWQFNARLSETATFERGTGVVVEFVKIGRGRNAPVILRRAGRATATFATKVTLRRTSSGFGQRLNLTPVDQCLPVTEDLSSGPDCDKDIPSRTNLGLAFAQSSLRLRLSGLGALEEIDCPVSQVFGGTPDLKYGWPLFTRLRPEFLPSQRIFGSARVIVVVATSGDSPTRTTEPARSGTLTGSSTDIGRTRVILRFIRLS